MGAFNRNQWVHITGISSNHGTELNGAPIIGMIDGGAADLINESDCGLSVNASDYKQLVKVVRNEILANKEKFAEKGENGKRFFKANFTLDVCINNLINIIEDGAR